MRLQTIILFTALLWLQQPLLGQNYDKLIEKGDYNKLYNKIARNIEKDSSDAYSFYQMSSLFIEPLFGRYNLDSSFRYHGYAFNYFSNADEKQYRKWGRQGFGKPLLVRQRQKIDSLTFKVYEEIDTESGYQTFLNKRPGSVYQEEAIERRNELGYQKALEVNTFQAFLQFITKYPDASQIQLAKEFYQKRLYEQQTPTKTLEEFVKFIVDYPTSPYWNDAHQAVFKLGLEEFSVENAMWIIENYDYHPISEKTKNLLYLWSLDADDSVYVPTDSIRLLEKLRNKLLIPTINMNFYGLTDIDNNIIIPFVFDTLYRAAAPDYLLFTHTDQKQQIRTVTNEVLLDTVVDIALRSDVGYGWILIALDSKDYLFHTFLKQLIPVESVQVAPGGAFLLNKDGQLWKVISIAGYEVKTFEADSIQSTDYDIMIQKNGKWGIIKPKELLNDIFKNPYDSIWRLQKNLIIAFEGGRSAIFAKGEKVADNLNGLYDYFQENDSSFKLEFDYFSKILTLDGKLFPYYDPEEIFSAGPGWVIRSDETYVLYNERWEDIYTGDSLIFPGNRFAFDPVVQVLIGSNNRIVIPDNTTITPLFQPGSLCSFIELKTDNVSYILNLQLDTLYAYDKNSPTFTPVSDHLLKVNHQKSVELVTADSIYSIKEHYKIVKANDSAVHLLMDEKFGYFNPFYDQIIEPEYSRLLKPINSNCFVVTKEKSGVICGDSVVLPPAYDRIEKIDKYTIIASSDQRWNLIALKNADTLVQEIIRYQLIEDRLIFQTLEGKGIYRNSHLLPPDFLEINTMEYAGNTYYMCWSYDRVSGLYLRTFYDDEFNRIYAEAQTEKNYERLLID